MLVLRELDERPAVTTCTQSAQSLPLNNQPILVSGGASGSLGVAGPSTRQPLEDRSAVRGKNLGLCCNAGDLPRGWILRSGPSVADVDASSIWIGGGRHVGDRLLVGGLALL